MLTDYCTNFKLYETVGLLQIEVTEYRMDYNEDLMDVSNEN